MEPRDYKLIILLASSLCSQYGGVTSVKGDRNTEPTSLHSPDLTQAVYRHFPRPKNELAMCMHTLEQKTFKKEVKKRFLSMKTTPQ